MRYDVIHDVIHCVIHYGIYHVIHDTMHQVVLVRRQGEHGWGATGRAAAQKQRGASERETAPHDLLAAGMYTTLRMHWTCTAHAHAHALYMHLEPEAAPHDFAAGVHTLAASALHMQACAGQSRFNGERLAELFPAEPVCACSRE